MRCSGQSGARARYLSDPALGTTSRGKGPEARIETHAGDRPDTGPQTHDCGRARQAARRADAGAVAIPSVAAARGTNR